jgi:hypothetical protein
MKWHIDSGHGWLEVSKAKLKSLGIAHKISSFSYEKGNKAYLEEDCDTSLFFESYFNDKEWFKKESLKQEYHSIPEKIYKRDATVRGFASYQAI